MTAMTHITESVDRLQHQQPLPPQPMADAGNQGSRSDPPRLNHDPELEDMRHSATCLDRAAEQRGSASRGIFSEELESEIRHVRHVVQQLQNKVALLILSLLPSSR